MFKPAHFGLCFNAAQVKDARRNRQREPFAAAFARLAEPPSTATPLTQALWSALRYRFNDDQAAGNQALKLLHSDDEPTPSAVLIAAHSFEMLRDLFPAAEQTRWLEKFQQQVDHLKLRAASDHSADSYVESVWQMTVSIVAGVVLEQSERFDAGAAEFQRIVAEDIHPNGYLTRAVDAHDGAGLARQISCVQALVLAAETAAHAGVDLWAFSARGVSVTTTAAYPLYYYFYPEKWRWDADLNEATAQPYYQHNGGFLEILYRRTRLHDAMLLLKALRPVVDPVMGGIPTLTHGVPKGLFG
jgi:hypothetical protein